MKTLENNAPVEKENVYYYHQDHLGSSNFITDYKGNIYEHKEYTPYGETWVEESNDTMSYINYKFTSKEFDEETELYYFSAKYYDPKECRSFLKSYNALFYIFI